MVMELLGGPRTDENGLAYEAPALINHKEAIELLNIEDKNMKKKITKTKTTTRKAKATTVTKARKSKVRAKKK